MTFKGTACDICKRESRLDDGEPGAFDPIDWIVVIKTTRNRATGLHSKVYHLCSETCLATLCAEFVKSVAPAEPQARLTIPAE